MKKNLIRTALFAVVALAGYMPVNAAQLHPLTSKIVDVISKSADANAARDALCGQKGILRGSGFSAGDNCKIQIFALFYVTACKDYPGAKEAKCYKNAESTLGRNQASPAAALENASLDFMNAARARGTNADTLLCKPDRTKLPLSLRPMADEVCRPFKLLFDEDDGLIKQLQDDEHYLELMEGPLKRAPKEILSRSARDVNKDLQDLKGKIANYIRVTHQQETLSANDKVGIQGLLRLSDDFIKKLETMGIRYNKDRNVVEVLNDQTKAWMTMR
ncbi:MAG: hypothetical protein H2057_01915 [Alphaproteobacteria bacterium]|nr:hypothetical protein [Alphaproteobacteria bacterium]